MRKIYSLVLMTAMLFVGANLRAANLSGTTGSELQTAINAIMTGSTNDPVITLTQNVELGSQVIWVGTANLTDTYRTVTLDLNGHNITKSNASDAVKMFVLSHGKLSVINNSANESIIKLEGHANSSSEIFTVYGSYRSSRWNSDGDELVGDGINTRTNGYFSFLEIGERVKILAVDGCEGTGICVNNDLAASYNGTNLTYTPKIGIGVDNSANATYGYAFGVRIDVRGSVEINGKSGDASKSYGIKVNGTVQSPISATDLSKLVTTMNGNIVNYLANYHRFNDTIPPTPTHREDTIDVPFIHIYPSANIYSRPTGNKSTAVYASGYAKWLIEGTCEGKTGIYCSSGVVELNDANVSSNAETYKKPTDDGSANGGGSGIVINSRGGGYSGDMNVTISGDTRVAGTDGYAIEEIVNSTQTITNPDYDPDDPESPEKITVKETKVENITINGGTIEGGNQGAISVSETTIDDPETNVVVYGGQVNGETQAGNGDLNVIVAKDDEGNPTVHTTAVVVDGKTTYIVTEGAAPTTEQTKTRWSDIASLESGSNAKWTGTGETDGVGTISGLVTLGELQILSATAPTGAGQQKLTITSTGELHVNHLMMNQYAQIVVEAGGKLIVNGTQGIVAPKTSNIILRTSETAQAIFLFNPAVTSNRHPNATVELISDSYRNSATDRHNHRFGIPMYTGVTSITASPAVATAFFKFDYANDSWLNIGYLNHTTYGDNVDLTQMNMPFEYYQLLCNVSSGSTTTFTFTGSLVGNDNVAKTIAPDVWYGICNSYMGEMDLVQIVNSMSGTMSKTIWTYETSGESAWAWKVANLATAVYDGIDKIKPMQAFLIHNVSDDAAAEATLSYETTVWNPAMGIAGAPARRLSAVSWTSAKMIVSSDNGYGDQLLLIQGNDFTSDFDNGYDAEKYFNGDINFYISDNRAMSVLATDNLADTYLGFSCVNGGIYTIDFSNVNGESYDLIDLEANQTVHMTEGASYQFAANDNEQNDYRFRIVPRQEMPTEVETVEENTIQNVGVYTLTGQYLGEMNVWNSLPAGLYIVNGEKKVK